MMCAASAAGISRTVACKRDSLQMVVVGEPELICILSGLLFRTCWWNSFCRPTVTAPLVTCMSAQNSLTLLSKCTFPLEGLQWRYCSICF